MNKVSACLRIGESGKGVHHAVHGLVQQIEVVFKSEQKNAGRGLCRDAADGRAGNLKIIG